MNEARARRFLAPGDPVPGRLETQFEQRQTGWQINQKTGLPEPVITTYHIGHGQQIARRDLAARRAARSAITHFTRKAGETGRQLATRLQKTTPARTPAA